MVVVTVDRPRAHEVLFGDEDPVRGVDDFLHNTGHGWPPVLQAVKQLLLDVWHEHQEAGYALGRMQQKVGRAARQAEALRAKLPRRLLALRLSDEEPEATSLPAHALGPAEQHELVPLTGRSP